MAEKVSWKDLWVDEADGRIRYNLVDRDGNIVVPDVKLEISSTVQQDGDQFGSREIAILLTKWDDGTITANFATLEDLERYMPVAGGDFTGNIFAPGVRGNSLVASGAVSIYNHAGFGGVESCILDVGALGKQYLTVNAAGGVLSSGAHPLSNNGGTLGTAARRWGGLYVVSGNVSGALDVGGSLSVGGSLNAGGKTIITLSDSDRIFIGDKDTHSTVICYNGYLDGSVRFRCFDKNGGFEDLMRLTASGSLITQGTYRNTTTSSGYQNVVINSNGTLYRFTSSRRFKDNIMPVDADMAADTLRKLRAVHFTSLCEGDDPNKVMTGGIAEEFYDVDTSLAGVARDEDGNICYGEDGEPLLDGIDNNGVLYRLLAGWQQHDKRMEELEEKAAKFDRLAALLVSKGLVTEEEIQEI